MSGATIEMRSSNIVAASAATWQKHGDNARVCRAVFCPEPEGGFSVYATRLPGVASQGDTLQEAIDNIRDAFFTAIEVYLTEHASIPWEDAEVNRPAGSFERWILVDG